MRVLVLLAAAGLVITSSPVDAKPKKKAKPAAAKAAKKAPPPGKGFWKVLVQPHAKWTLKNEVEDAAAPTEDRSPLVTVETYDVRKVGDADVARLRWRQGDGDDSPLVGTHAPPMEQFAVTDKGLYFLKGDATDDQIVEALKGKPARSDPPKAYKGTKLNEGRFLEIRGDIVCMGQGPLPGDGECDDVCEGAVCISATDGIVRLEGNWAPDMFDYVNVEWAKKK